MMIAGLNQESHFDITGEGLEKIKQDPAIKETQKDIMNSKNPVEVEPVRTDLAGDGSLLGQSRDETFWMVNVGWLSATDVQVSSSGKITTTWLLEDIFNFRPLKESEFRSDTALAKNDIPAYIIGGIYHDILGATDEMTSSATWTTTTCPDGSTSESGWCSGDEKE